MKKLVVGNMKMHLMSATERVQYMTRLKKAFADKKLSDTATVLCPPFVHLEAWKKNLPPTIILGAQNTFWQQAGAYTGEISPHMLKNFGVCYVIVGHSERRKHLGETSEMVAAKIKALLAVDLTPIVCVGRTREAQDLDPNFRMIAAQIQESIVDVKHADISKIVFVYEPVWAIGTGQTPTSDEIMSVRVLVQKILTDLYGVPTARKLRMLYGGSVTPDNVAQVCHAPELDGVLVGGGSLDPDEFARIAQVVDNKR